MDSSSLSKTEFPNRIGVLLADNHALIRAGIRTVLERSPDIRVIAEASSDHEVFGMFKKLRPDVVILDVNISEMSGLETVRQLLSVDPRARILVLTIQPERLFAIRLLKAGVLGYITKNASSQLLLQAVKSVASGRKYFLGGEDMSTSSSWSYKFGPVDFLLETLSDREMQILCLIARGYAVKDMAKELGVAPKTIYSHRLRVLEKLSLHNDVEICRFAIQHGIVEFMRGTQSPSALPSQVHQEPTK